MDSGVIERAGWLQIKFSWQSILRLLWSKTVFTCEVNFCSKFSTATNTTKFASDHPKKILLNNAAETNEAAAQGYVGGDWSRAGRSRHNHDELHGVHLPHHQRRYSGILDSSNMQHLCQAYHAASRDPHNKMHSNKEGIKGIYSGVQEPREVQ